MHASTKYPFDPFIIFLVPVLLITGTRFWGAGTAGYTVQPAKDPGPQPPTEDPTNREHNDAGPVDEKFQHSETPLSPPGEKDTGSNKPESAGTDPQGTAVTEDIKTPPSTPPVTLPAAKSTPDLWRWPAQSK